MLQAQKYPIYIVHPLPSATTLLRKLKFLPRFLWMTSNFWAVKVVVVYLEAVVNHDHDVGQEDICEGHQSYGQCQICDI